MSERNDKSSDESLGSWSNLDRRPLLKALGAGAALSLGMRGTAASEHGSGAENETNAGNESGVESGTDGHFVEDLVDPVFGYPLAAEETDDLDLEHVVEMSTVEGSGAHENFPQGPPQQENGGEGGDGGFPFEFSFDPVGLQVAPGGLVHFKSVAGEHTATAFHEKYSNPEMQMPNRVPDSVPGFTSPPIVRGESWVYQFSTPGVYDLLCLPHVVFGMVMRVVAIDPEEHDVEDETFAEPSGGELPPDVTAVLTADELDPANIVEQGTVAWEDLTIEVGAAEGASGGGGTNESGTNETG